MMIFREVNSLKIVEYIRCAWGGDVNLPVFYDRSLKEKSLDSMVKNTHDKILEFTEIENGLKLIGIDYDDEMIGFIILHEKLHCLYSFGVKYDFRKKEILEPIFWYIKTKLNDSFYCMLHEYNTRAIRWLKKCGMKERQYLSPQKDIIYLNYEKCQ